MPLHQSEVITYTQADEQLRRRVRALIAREHALAKRPPDPEIDLDRIMWEIAVDSATLAFLGLALASQADVAAKIATASDAALLGVIKRALAS